VSEGARTWRAGKRSIELNRPIVAGIVNVTPDSFSDGGRFFSVDAAVGHALDLLRAGADLVDIGGESTRPGAAAVSAGEEIERVLPVVEAIHHAAPEAIVSVDTVKADVAAAALDAGADVINDVSAHRLDPRMSAVCAAAGCGVVLMHSRGAVAEMAKYDLATYGTDPTGEVCLELSTQARIAEAAGITRDRIVLDPGIGFSKRTVHSVRVLQELGRVVDLGFPVLVGVSRKRIIGDLTGVGDAGSRDSGTVAVNVFALSQGARIFRVHDVAVNRQALDGVWQLFASRR
jgi:dihydropteroate synthase